MTLMKQARAFGVGMVLATQNPVDLDYKAISNAGTWMVGRLQTERDKARLLEGMSAADGGVDVRTVGDTISGLAKREFVLRRAGQTGAEVFTSRWAMSYLRGPLTRDQIASLMASQREAETAPAAGLPGGSSRPTAAPRRALRRRCIRNDRRRHPDDARGRAGRDRDVGGRRGAVVERGRRGTRGPIAAPRRPSPGSASGTTRNGPTSSPTRNTRPSCTR